MADAILASSSESPSPTSVARKESPTPMLAEPAPRKQSPDRATANLWRASVAPARLAHANGVSPALFPFSAFAENLN